MNSHRIEFSGADTQDLIDKYPTREGQIKALNQILDVIFEDTSGYNAEDWVAIQGVFDRFKGLLPAEDKTKFADKIKKGTYQKFSEARTALERIASPNKRRFIVTD